MDIRTKLIAQIAAFISEKAGQPVAENQIVFSPTKKEFEGDYTLLVFPFVRFFRSSPEQAGTTIGEYLVEHSDYVDGFNVIKGFLNLSMNHAFWEEMLRHIQENTDYGKGAKKNETVMVEFSSPNTNKPLHLGHIRNILLGWSVSEILDFAGFEVLRTQIINDRGIAVCKSMLAWQKFGEGATPESSGKKGDHFVGEYYVTFDQQFRAEYEKWQQTETAQQVYEQSGTDLPKDAFFKKYKNDYFNDYSQLGNEAREMLRNWEAGETETVKLWQQMNGWVYEGFEKTYRDMGVRFDHYYYESDTFKKGKAIVEEGLDKGLFYKEEDGSIWVDLTNAKMDKKILLRSDGTALYITQDLGTAEQRYEDHKATRFVYVVGDEQDYHFKVLFEIMKRLERPYAGGLFHLSYGMVDLPTGRMKSREGTVVDADDLMQEVIDEAWKSARERAKEQGKELVVTEEEVKKIALAALKFFIIKVHPQKRMVFNPEESLDMQGQTGPYVQNAYVRIQSIFRKLQEEIDLNQLFQPASINDFERQLMAALMEFPNVVAQAANEYQPSHIANYCYDLAKKMHKFYAEVQILSEPDAETKGFRLQLIQNVAKVLESGMRLLGIEMVDKM